MRRRVLFVASAGVLSVAALGFASVANVRPRLVWNASGSAPIGLYRIEFRPPRVGDYVLVSSTGKFGEFVADRGYLPPKIPLIKHVAALSGAEICRRNDVIFVGGIARAHALAVDSFGRKMPAWTGCFTLRNDEIFLLNAPQNSFDGRYFGATNDSEIVGVATPVFVGKAR